MERAEILSGGSGFSAWSGDAYASDIYRGAVDAIARNAAKLKGSHVIRYTDHEQAEGDCKINRLLQIEPNPYMSAFDLLYKLAQNEHMSVTLFSFDKGEEISTHESGGDAMVTCLDGVGRITIDGVEHILHEGESIVMPARHPHAVFGQEQFKMLLVVVF